MKRVRGRPDWGGRRLVWLLALAVVAVVLADACAGRRQELPAAPPEVGEPAAPSVEAALETEAVEREISMLPPTLAAAEGEATSVSPSPPIGPSLSIPPTLEVGLATDLTVVQVSCCASIDELRESGSRALGRVTVKPAPAAAAAPVYRLQVAALHDEGQAAGLARRLTARFGLPADSLFDAGSGLYRVRLGRYPDRGAAETARRRLEVRDLSGAWVVIEPGRLTDPALMVTVGDDGPRRVPGRWVTISARNDSGIEFMDRRYRGRLRVYLNDRASLNLINELPVEEYLRGVVPKEMGPNLYGNLEALKAQAVAARTYTLGNLGEFEEEGYDICATPRCQVYGGMNDEHPLSDRAVRQTAGQVVSYRGDLVDALYTSTCGGHTEDVSVVFPAKHEEYLKGVPCVETGIEWLQGTAAQGAVFPDDLMLRLLPQPQGSEVEQLSARLRSLARQAGLPLADDRLTSLERREVQRFLASTFDLALDVRLFSSSHRVTELIDHPPADWNAADLDLAAYLVRSGLLSDQLDLPVAPAERERMLFQLALFLHVLESREMRYQSRTGESLRVRGDEGVETLRLAPGVATFRSHDGEVSARDLALVPGDPLVVYLSSGRPVAIVHQTITVDAAFDRFRRKSSWTRYRSDVQLSELVMKRYPGLRFRGLEILSRGVSGRVGKLNLLGADGTSVLIEGLAIRWTLDLPDTWFTVKRLRPPDQEPKWLFSGRGWGHGVGMCQVGAYGMGLRGHDYRHILEHYYSGAAVVELGPLSATMAGGR